MPEPKKIEVTFVDGVMQIKDEGRKYKIKRDGETTQVSREDETKEMTEEDKFWKGL